MKLTTGYILLGAAIISFSSNYLISRAAQSRMADMQVRYETRYNPSIELVLMDEKLCHEYETESLCKTAIESRRRYRLNQRLAIMYMHD